MILRWTLDFFGLFFDLRIVMVLLRKFLLFARMGNFNSLYGRLVSLLLFQTVSLYVFQRILELSRSPLRYYTLGLYLLVYSGKFALLLFFQALYLGLRVLAFS